MLQLYLKPALSYHISRVHAHVKTLLATNS